MKPIYDEKRFDENTGKLHLPCPHPEKSGVKLHVVIRGGYCYRSGQCMVIPCRYNAIHLDIRALLSLVW